MNRPNNPESTDTQMKHFHISIKRFPHATDLPLPRYMTPGSAGMDLLAAITEPVILAPGAFQAIPTGIAIALPEGLEAMVRPRSGLAFKHGITSLNTPGTIDSDYRGEIKVLLINHGPAPFRIERGDRIAQMVINEIVRAEWVEQTELDDTERGTGGFGHTGLS